MEHPGVLSTLSDLPGAPSALVAEFVLPAPLAAGGSNDVFPGPPLDGQPAGGLDGWIGFRLQRPGSQHAHLAQLYRHSRLDSRRHTLLRTGLAGRGTAVGSGRIDRGHADAVRHARAHSLHLAGGPGALAGPILAE